MCRISDFPRMLISIISEEVANDLRSMKNKKVLWCVFVDLNLSDTHKLNLTLAGNSLNIA